MRRFAGVLFLLTAAFGPCQEARPDDPKHPTLGAADAGDPKAPLSLDAAVQLAQIQQNYTVALKEASKARNNALADLNAIDVLNVGGIEKIKDIHDRRELVRRFRETNQQLSELATHPEPFMIRELETIGLDLTQRDRFLNALREALDQPFEKKKRDNAEKARVLDDELGQTMLSGLELLEGQWGHWHAGPHGRPKFGNPALGEIYRKMMKRIQDAVAEQADLAH